MARNIQNALDPAERLAKRLEAEEINRQGRDRTVALGQARNNPGELGLGRKFKGMKATSESLKFATFENAVWGIRALAITLAESGTRPGQMFSAVRLLMRQKCGRDVYSDEEIGQGLRLSGVAA